MYSKKCALQLIFTFLFMVSSAFASDCIPGNIMVDKPGKSSNASAYIKYSKDLSGYTFNDVPDKNQYMVFVEHHGDQYFSISSSDWCYSPSTHSIIFLRKPLSVWDAWDVPDGAALFIFYHRMNS